MPRYRTSPLTATSVRQLASRRGYLLTKDGIVPRAYKLFDVTGRQTAPVPSQDPKRRYAWRLTDADAWLRERPLLRDQ